jgi:CRISPR-associated protein Cas2
MARRQYMIAYDISDDKRRTRVFKMLMGQGDHVQYSVFLCALTAQELVAARYTLGEIIHEREDQVIIVDLGRSDDENEPLIECLGKVYNPTTRVRIV